MRQARIWAINAAHVGRAAPQMPVATPRRPQLRTFIAAAAASNVSTSIQWMQPLLMSYLVLGQRMKPPAAGFLMTAEMGASALASVIVARLVQRRQAQRVALWGVCLAAIVSFITLYLDRYGALLVVRILAGLATGMTIMVANVVASNFADPDRFFAQVGLSNLAVGMLLVGIAPYLGTPYTVIFLSFLTLLPLMLLMPRGIEAGGSTAAPATQSGAPGQALGLYTVLIVAVTFTVNLCSGTVWGLYGLIGERSGISAQAVDSAITVSVAAGAVGVGLASVIGSSVGRIGPFGLSLVLMAGAILVLTSHPSVAAFRIAVCINVAAIYVIIPYLGGLAVALDRHGKTATYVSSAFFCAMALSPFVGGILVSTVSIESIGRMIVLLSVVCGVIYSYVARAAASASAQIALARAE
jgi:predicted MFS family arabinose efflux permease